MLEQEEQSGKPVDEPELWTYAIEVGEWILLHPVFDWQKPSVY